MRIFPFEFEKPIKDDQTKKCYLTISALINDCSNPFKIHDIQKEILANVKISKILGKNIYKYPLDRLHFSIINFPKFSIETSDIEKFKKDFATEILSIKNELSDLSRKIHVLDNSIKIAYIYPFKSSSIALQAFPSKELCQLFEKIKNKFISMGFEAEIKGYEYGENFRFAINIVRFFKELECDEFRNIKAIVDSVNSRSLENDNIFYLNLDKLTFVISDNWLGNDDFEQLKISVN